MDEMKIALVCVFAFVVAGCATSSNVLVGTKRSPIPVEQVKLYLEAPAAYEQVALLEGSSKNSWSVTDQGKTNKAIERLKAEAAKLGANGILLSGTATSSGGGAFIAQPTGGGVFVADQNKVAKGIAIYVPPTSQ